MTKIALTLGCAAVVAIGVWLAFGLKEHDPAAKGIGREAGGWQVQMVRRGISELSEAARPVVPLTLGHVPAESLPHDLRRRVIKNLPGWSGLHLRFGQAHFARAGKGASLWLVEGKGVTCIFQVQSAASACRTRVDAAEEGLWLGTYKISKAHPERRSDFLAFGVVPSNIRAVLVQVVGSKGRKVVLTSNHVWAVHANTPIHVLRLMPHPDR